MITVGFCPHCGAPIYAPSVWHGITPPPSTYSCMCSNGNTSVGIVTTSSTAPNISYRK